MALHRQAVSLPDVNLLLCSVTPGTSTYAIELVSLLAGCHVASNLVYLILPGTFVKLGSDRPMLHVPLSGNGLSQSHQGYATAGLVRRTALGSHKCLDALP